MKYMQTTTLQLPIVTSNQFKYTFISNKLSLYNFTIKYKIRNIHYI